MKTPWMQMVCGLAIAAVLTAISGCGGPAIENGADSQTPDQPSAAKSTGLEPGPVDDNAPEEFTTTESGLKYRIRRQSDGKKPTASNTVSVHYKGWLDNETVFDSSYERGEPATFPLQGVIPGWTEGLQLVGEGGMIELEIPSDLGYGDFGMPPDIPPGATLHFLVELIEVR